jgi:hypothetical protein
MHQPNRLPDLNDSRAAIRGSGLRNRQNPTSPTSKPAPPRSTTIGVNRLQQQVRQLHTHVPAPVWLRSLLTAQKASKILFGSVFGLSLVVYGYTMHTQTTWRTQQEQLRRWQNQERQQGVMNENLKQELAKIAESKGSGLVDPKPQMAVFVYSAPSRQPKPLPAQVQAPKSLPASKTPSGY